MAKKSTKRSALGKSADAGSGRSSSPSPMDPTLLERLVKLMNDHDVTSLDVRDGAQRVSLKRGAQVVMGGSMPVSYAHAPAPVASAASSAPQSAAPAGNAPASENEGLIPIKSPMVGTFYAAPNPDAKPFVSVGSEVNEDSDVCMIEAMKVFNNIKAETRGTISKVCVQNGKPVEFGTVLFLVKP